MGWANCGLFVAVGNLLVSRDLTKTKMVTTIASKWLQKKPSSRIGRKLLNFMYELLNILQILNQEKATISPELVTVN